MRKKKIPLRNVNATQCDTCIFRPGQTVITPERLFEIQEYLLRGTNHICHQTEKICRGGRDFQLTIFSRMGWITDATDAALYAAMDQIPAQRSPS